MNLSIIIYIYIYIRIWRALRGKPREAVFRPAGQLYVISYYIMLYYTNNIISLIYDIMNLISLIIGFIGFIERIYLTGKREITILRSTGIYNISV